MTAQAFGYEPNEIRIPRGATVDFVVTSKDVIHGFMIPGTTVNTMIIPGQVTHVQYTFDEPGEYTATVTVSDGTAEVSESVTVTVTEAGEPGAPAVQAFADPASGTAPLEVSFSANAIDPDGGDIEEYTWTFPGGGTAYGQTVTTTLTEPGTHEVTVTATDAAGHRVSVTRTIAVAPAPVVVLPDPRPKRVFAVTGATWDRLRNGRTRMLSLVVDELEGPELIKLTCVKRRHGCRKSATKTVKRHGRKVDLSKTVKGMVLRPGAKLTVTVTRPEHTGRVYQYTMIRGKKTTVRRYTD